MKTTLPWKRSVAVAIAAVLVLAGCSAGGSSSSSGSSATSIIEAIPAYPLSFSFDGLGSDSDELLQANNATLIRNPYVKSNDPKAETQDLYNWQGVLAKSYDISSNGLVYTFHLRHGVVSQAGNPFTADDVIWSFKRKWGAATGITSSIALPELTDPAKQIKKIDKYTVSFTVAKKGYGFSLLALISKISGHIYDSKLLKSHATKADPYAVTWSNEHGNYGYGAYDIASFKQGESIVLKANKNYPLGEPAIKQITMKVVPDAGNRALLLKQGAVQAATELLPSDVKSLEKDSSVDTYKPTTNNYLWAFLNTTKGPLKNQDVRQAFFYAVPYEQIIKSVYQGLAKPTKGLLDPSAPNYDGTGILSQSYQPAKSKALLAKAGMTSPVTVNLLMSNSQPDLQQAAIQMQSYAAKAGFKLTITVVPSATVTTKVNAKNYDVEMLRDMSISYESAPYSLLLAYPQNNPRNSTGWGTDAYYKAIDDGINAGDSTSVAASKDWNTAQLAWQAGRPQIQIAAVDPLMAMSSKLTGFAHRSDNIIDWSIVKPKK